MEQKLKNQIFLILVAASSLFLVFNIQTVLKGFSTFLGMMSPIILGVILAFIFNVPMKHMENQLKKLKIPSSIRRSIAILGVLLILMAIIIAILWIIVPTLANTIVQLSSSINYLIAVVIDWTQRTGFLESSDVERITTFINQSNIVSTVVSVLRNFTLNVTGIFSNVFSVLMAIFLMLNILGSKEYLQSVLIRLLTVSLCTKRVAKVRYIGNIITETYDKFLMGQLIEACIIGGLVFVFYSLCGFPYAAITGVLSGVLSFIPYIGPFAACVLGAVFIFTVSPLQAVLSILVFQLLQLVEGNFIYPRVVGNSIGLPTVFTLAAALIGGNLFGIIGMIFFTPLFAVVYRLVKETVEEHEKKLNQGVLENECS